MSRQARNFPGLKYRIFEKPYFGLFLYKVLFRGPDVTDYLTDYRFKRWNVRKDFHDFPKSIFSMIPKHELFELQKYRRLHMAIRTRAKELSGENNFRFRQDRGLSIYLYSLLDAQILVDEFHDHVLGVWGPLDDEHQKHAKNSPKIRIRSRLWRNQYRYRVVLKIDADQRHGLVRALEDLVIGTDYDINRNLARCIMDPFSLPSSHFTWQFKENLLYCVDERLIIMINLHCADAVFKIDKVVTHNELSQQKKTIT